MTYEQLISIINDEYQSEFMDFISDSTGEASLYDHAQAWFDDFESNFGGDIEPIIALMQHTGDTFDECSDLLDWNSYSVLTDSEADDAWEESLNNYLDDCVLPELPESMRSYFDRDSWLSVARMDGRGHSLAMYDGNEYEEVVNGTSYFIYRCD